VSLSKAKQLTANKTRENLIDYWLWLWL